MTFGTGTAVSALAVALIAAGAPASAQTTAPATQDAPAQPASADPSTSADNPSEEVVVTAQRVEQNLQDVPLAVTAIGAATLQRQNITDATRLENIAPGLTIGRSGTDLRPAIRGVRTENVGANADPTIGFFIDGVYQSRPSQALAGFVDLERVEVLRGPQGTLFGRNTYGGAISLVSARPTQQSSGELNVLYGRFNRARLDGYVNAPLSDGLAVRLASAVERMSGYVDNLAAGGDLGKNREVYFRPSVRLDRGNVDWIVRGAYWRQTGSPLGAFGYKSRGTLIDPSLVSATNGGRSLGPNAQFYSINTRVRDGIADINGFDVGVPIISDPYTVAFDSPSRLRNVMWQGNSDLTIDLGPAKLRAITGYVDWESFRSIDNDFTAYPIATDYNITYAKTFSQELQLVGKSRAVDWIVGAFYYHDKVREIFFNDQNNAYPAVGSPEALGPPFQAGTPTSGPFLIGRADNLTPVSVRTESLAGFGQATVRLSDAFSLTGGLRWTQDKKRYSRQLINTLAGVTLADAAAAPFTQRDQRATFEKVTWKAGAEYKPAADSLIYAQVSTGFTSGGFNGGTFTNAGVVTPLPPFEPQTVTAYEVGSKNRFMDGMLQLNGALFYNDLNNLQVQSQVPFGGTVLSITGNAGQARSYGGEIEAVLRPTRALTIGLNAAYLNARYKTLLLNNPFANPAQACSAATVGAAIPLRVGVLRCVNPAGTTYLNQVDLAGARIPYSPRLTVQSSLSYAIDTGFGTITPSAQMLYNSGYFNTDFNTLVDKQKAFTKTDLRLTWTSLDRKLSLQAYVENLEDEAVNQRGVFGTNQSLNASYGMPRTYGIKGGIRF